jgi:hypothetical protein
MLYAILTEDGLDQVVETKEQLDKEVKYLKEIARCKVRVKKFNTWEAFDAFEEKLNS